MNGLDWILLIATGTALWMAVRSLYKNRKNGGCAGCSGNCGNCIRQKNTKNSI